MNSEAVLTDLELERKVLAGVFTVPDAILGLRPVLLPDDFSDDRHAVIFETMLQLLQQQIRPTMDNVLLKLSDVGWLDRNAGGEGYVVGLSPLPSGAVDVPVWGERIANLAVRRSMCRLAREIDEKARDMRVDVADLRRQLAQLVVEGKRKLGAGKYDEIASFTDDAGRIVMGWFNGQLLDVVPTGIPSLDRAIGGGLGKGQYTVIGGRPGMGKTYLAEIILRNAEEAGMTCAFASLEMRGVDLAIRDICREARVSGLSLRNKEHVGDPEIENRLRRAITKVAKRTTMVNDFGEQSAADMQLAMLLLSLEHGSLERSGLDLLIVDYIELMKDVSDYLSAEDGKKPGVPIAERRLKGIAKSIGCAVVGLSQITKADAGNPTLESLMYSGGDVQDLVLILYWPWKVVARGSKTFMKVKEMGEFLPGQKPEMEDLVVLIRKGRFTGEDHVLLRIQPQYGIIEDRHVIGGGRP